MEKGKSDRSNTPFDDVFKSVANKCPQLLLPLINEMFYKSKMIGKPYDGTEKIVLLNTDIVRLDEANLHMDLLFLVSKDGQKEYFHMECQSTIDPHMDQRLFDYVHYAVQKEDSMNIYPFAGVLSLRSNKNTGDYFSSILKNNPRQDTGPMIFPNLKMRDYTLDSIREKKLFFLLPFLMFNYEKELKKEKSAQNPEKDNGLSTESYKILQDIYYNIIQTLEESIQSKDLTYYEAHTLYDAMKVVFRALASNVDLQKEVNKIMAGKILEFSADKYYDAGKKVGREEGREKGREEGREEGMEDLQEIIHGLALENEPDTILRLISDKKFREKMYEKCKNNASGGHVDLC